MTSEFPAFHERTGPQHRVYVIEVERLDPSITWDLYVGSTNLYLRERWERYEQLTDTVSKYFRRGQVRALGYRYDLMKGWGPYDSKEECLVAEGALAAQLQRDGYAVYSDRLKYALDAATPSQEQSARAGSWPAPN